MKIRGLKQIIATALQESEILAELRRFIVRLHRIWSDSSGTGEPEAVTDVLCGALAIQNIVIGGATYLVRSHFREDTTATAVDKIARLIEKDAENSQ